MKRILPLIFLLLIIIESCVVKRQQFGEYENQVGEETIYEKGKDIYLFWDQIPLQKVDKNLEKQDYEKIVKRNVFDAFITYGTMGIVSYYSVKIKIKESDHNNKN